MNKFLQTRSEVDQCTAWLKLQGLISHHFTCKDFEIYSICKDWFVEAENAILKGESNSPKALKTFDLLDMGSSGSWILHNAIKMGIKGKKCGIDLSDHESPIAGVGYTKGDLMATPYKDKSFDTITCLSVIEHEVDFDKLASECSRILRKGGVLYISFDYWNPKVNTDDVGTKLYGLKWNILDASDVSQLEVALGNNGLRMSSNLNWTTKDAVINDQFCAPYGKRYTFGLLKFIKA